MKNIFTKNKINENAKLQNEKQQDYSKKLKEVLCEGENKYDKNYSKDGTYILKHSNFFNK